MTIPMHRSPALPGNKINAGCKHFGGPENIPVSRFSFDAKVSIYCSGTPLIKDTIKGGGGGGGTHSRSQLNVHFG